MLYLIKCTACHKGHGNVEERILNTKCIVHLFGRESDLGLVFVCTVQHVLLLPSALSHRSKETWLRNWPAIALQYLSYFCDNTLTLMGGVSVVRANN
jgi:hypothetical protein